jgi:hypothetical protein
MAIGLDPKQIVLNDELLLSQVVSQEAIIRLLVRKGIFTKEEVFGNGREGKCGNGEDDIASQQKGVK